MQSRYDGAVHLVRVLVALCTLTLALAACAPEAADDSRPARLIGPADFAAAVSEPARVTINVHVPFEGDIPGTDLSIPFDQITQRANELPGVDTPLAIYCRSGPMSTQAAADLGELGYTDVVELRGGMKAWQAEGRPLVGV